MAYRRKMNKRASRRNFTKHAKSHRKNHAMTPMRGGLRL